MKLATLLTPLLFLASSGLAMAETDCYEKLTQGLDSVSYHVLADFGEGTSSAYQAGKLVERALEKVGCTLDDVSITNTSCKKIVPDDASTEVCYVKADIGYFFTAKDYVDTANVIFNRWD